MVHRSNRHAVRLDDTVPLVFTETDRTNE